MKVAPVNTDTPLKAKSLEFLEDEIGRVNAEIHELVLSLRVLDPPVPPSTLPLNRLIVRDAAEMQQMTEADLLQEMALVKAGVLRLSVMLDSESASDQERMRLEIAQTADDLKRVSLRDVAHGEDANELFCLCQLPYNGARMMIQCDSCEEWFHITCVGLLYKSVPETEEYTCPRCKSEGVPDSTGILWALNEGDSPDAYVDVDSVLCRKGSQWLEVEIEAISKEIDVISKECMRIKRAMKRANAREAKRLAEEEAERLAAAREQARREKEIRQRDLEEEEASELTGDALRKEVHRLMTEYGVTQSGIVADTGIIGGASAVSGLLKGVEVPRKAEKELTLRRWLLQAYARIERGELHKKTSSEVSSRRSSMSWSVDDLVDACTSAGEWMKARISSLSKNRVKVQFLSEAAPRETWIPLQSGRLAAAGTHTMSPDVEGDESRRKRESGDGSAKESEPEMKKMKPEPGESGRVSPQEAAAILSLQQMKRPSRRMSPTRRMSRRIAVQHEEQEKQRFKHYQENGHLSPPANDASH